MLQLYLQTSKRNLELKSSAHLFPPTLGAAAFTFLVAFMAAFCALLSLLAAGFFVVAFFASLAALTACSLWAFLTSGFWFLLAMMSWRVAPTTARWNFWVRLVLFFWTSSSSPFLCFLL